MKCVYDATIQSMTELKELEKRKKVHFDRFESPWHDPRFDPLVRDPYFRYPCVRWCLLYRNVSVQRHVTAIARTIKSHAPASGDPAAGVRSSRPGPPR